MDRFWGNNLLSPKGQLLSGFLGGSGCKTMLDWHLSDSPAGLVAPVKVSLCLNTGQWMFLKYHKKKIHRPKAVKLLHQHTHTCDLVLQWLYTADYMIFIHIFIFHIFVQHSRDCFILFIYFERHFYVYVICKTLYLFTSRQSLPLARS